MATKALVDISSEQTSAAGTDLLFVESGGTAAKITKANLLGTTLVSVSSATAAGLALLDDADAAAQRTTLGLGTASVANLLDEDDMASDSATGVPSQQSVKAYVDASVVTTTTAGPTTLSGSGVDFASIPAGVDEIKVIVEGALLSGNMLVQLSTGASFVATGYDSRSYDNSTVTSTLGFVMKNDDFAVMDIYRVPGTNRWVATHASNICSGSGGIDLGGEMDGLRFTRTGSNSYSAGTVSLRYS